MRKTLSIATAALAALAALVLAGCSSIDEGTITGKEYEPGHYYTTTICTGKPMICVPQTRYDDPDWRFDLTSGDDTGWVYVTEETFNSYAVGDYYGG